MGQLNELDETVMGQWVDAWLQSLRAHGLSDLQLLVAAKALGKATADGSQLHPHHPNQFVREFYAWAVAHQAIP